MRRFGITLFLLCLGVGSVFAVTAEDYYKAGISLYQQKQFNRAIQYFQAAVQTNPNYWEAYQVLGQTYYQAGDEAKALQAMDQSLNLHPENPPLRNFADTLRPPPLPAPGTASGSSSPAKTSNIPIVLQHNVIFGKTYIGSYHESFGDIDSGMKTTAKNAGGNLYSTGSLGVRSEIAFSWDTGNAIGIQTDYSPGSQYSLTVFGFGNVTIWPNLFASSVVYYHFLPDGLGRWYAKGSLGYYSTAVAYSQNGSAGNLIVGTSLTGGTVGGSLTVGRELLLAWIIGIDVEASYRFASIGQVTGPYNGGTGTLALDSQGDIGLVDAKSVGKNGIKYASVDLSGYDFGLALELDF